MALHRDIFWIGRQWAVTGHGMQLIDQRLEGAFDIAAGRLWDDELIEGMRAKAWLKAEDFEKGLTVARTRHSQPSEALSTEALPPEQPMLQVPAPEPAAPPLPVEKAEVAQLEQLVAIQSAQPEAPAVIESPPPAAAEPTRQASPGLQMRTQGAARFARPWRVWMKKS
jgi:hypothetical protein